MGREIPSNHIEYIRGRPYVPYASLLDIAHQDGLISISAEFITVTESLATATATVKFKDGRVFTESGEATPTNVTSYVRPSFARMALTRAKGRALRDALNVDLVTSEEMPDMTTPTIPEAGVPASQDRIDYLSYLLTGRGVRPELTRTLIEIMTSSGEPMSRVIDASINRVSQRTRLPDGWFRAYIKMLRELHGIDQRDVVAHLMEVYQKDTPNALLDHEQKALINWICSKNNILKHDSNPPEQEEVTETTFDWVALIDSISTHTGHEYADVENWILSTYAADGQEITDLPESCVDAIASQDLNEIGAAIDIYMGDTGG